MGLTEGAGGARGAAAAGSVVARDVWHAYGHDPDLGELPRARAALRGASLDVAPGQLVALVGANGSGKSTLARHLDALLPLQEGALRVCGWDASDPDVAWELRRSCAMVFQNPENQFVSTEVGEDVCFGPLNYGCAPDAARRRAADALRTVGLPGFEGRDVHELSGGQQQRVALAGVLALDPELVVLDEATSMLDPQGAREVLSAVADARRERGCAVLLVTHDMDLAAHADSVAVMSAGRVLAQGAPADVLRDRALLAGAGLEEPFAAQVWDALVRAGAACGEAPVTVEGLVGALCC